MRSLSTCLSKFLGTCGILFLILSCLLCITPVAIYIQAEQPPSTPLPIPHPTASPTPHETGAQMRASFWLQSCPNTPQYRCILGIDTRMTFDQANTIIQSQLGQLTRVQTTQSRDNLRIYTAALGTVTLTISGFNNYVGSILLSIRPDSTLYPDIPTLERLAATSNSLVVDSSDPLKLRLSYAPQ